MSNYVGIDLGTTNSVISSYDGLRIRTWKNPEQSDVTPSAIYIDKRGGKYVGLRAYNMSSRDPGNCAVLFKRLMGTSTKVHFAASDTTKTPEECSAELLKSLFGYLPEEIRSGHDTGTVITVPAAFNQMQKTATMEAANMAGIGSVALMQEPVAAVMSVMRANRSDGMFLIYDLGGGTLDIAVAESSGGRVNLLAHGGIAMCGGRDFDRAIFDNIVKPWLLEKFSLPDDFQADPAYRTLARWAASAAENAKIALSSARETTISLPADIQEPIRDTKGTEIYFDIPLRREVYDELIAERVAESINAARDTLQSAGLTSRDPGSIVFIGGPTSYKPLRDRVAGELGISGGIDVNPMTAVAEGASLFAESIDWSARARSRKGSRGHISSGGELNLSFNYNARTSEPSARISAILPGGAPAGCEFQADSMDTGWTSGRIRLEDGATIDVPLPEEGENKFKISAFGKTGGPVKLDDSMITITRTAATVGAIPASHSVGVEVLEKIGGKPALEYLVRRGDALPKKGKKTFKAAEALKAGSAGSLNFKLWEGEIKAPITDNRPIGVFKISGADFDDGAIPEGADLECEYEILDSGHIDVRFSVPCIGGSFRSDKNFYSRQEGQVDYSSSAFNVVSSGRKALLRINEIKMTIDDPRLLEARRKAESVVSLGSDEKEAEKIQEADENIRSAKMILAQVREEHLREIRSLDLDKIASTFENDLRAYATPSEAADFENLAETARRSIDRDDADFEFYLGKLESMAFGIQWRQDWFIAEVFKRWSSLPQIFADRRRFDELVSEGRRLVSSGETEKLRDVMLELLKLIPGVGPDISMSDVTNIIRG